MDSEAIAIRVENLSKLYRIGLKQKIHDTLLAGIVDFMKSPFKNYRAYRSLYRFNDDEIKGLNNHNAKNSDTVWALKDVSFDVRIGEVLGIIGRNGAGKSTLLKILSKITVPTKGFAEIRGRISSLLEVGTGFHQELTGKENVYLNGTILGMTKKEIDRKYDEIVDFSGIERFIDTPVKRYSSGMKVRLAFSVAAHLEPEILLIDEVLAVGDVEFQKKCLGKMDEVATEGRTILFVSHNMVALQSLCDQAIWIDEGMIVEKGETSTIVSNYLRSSISAVTEQVWNDVGTAPGNDKVRLRRISVRSENGSLSEPITMETPCVIEVEFWNKLPDARLHITLHIYTEKQIVAFSTGSSRDRLWRGRALPVGLFRSSCKIPGNLLNSGLYRVVVLVVQNGSTVIYQHEDAISFDIIDIGRRQISWYGKEPGVVSPVLEWSTVYLGENEVDKIASQFNMKQSG